MTMSWVADRKAVTIAQKAKSPRWSSGWLAPSIHTDTNRSAWMKNSQARRCPTSRVSTGKRSRSISGAQRNLSV